MELDKLEGILSDEKQLYNDALKTYRRVLRTADPTPEDVAAFRAAKAMLGKSEKAVTNDLRSLHSLDDIEKRIEHATGKETTEKLSSLKVQILEFEEETAEILRDRQATILPSMVERMRLQSLQDGVRDLLIARDGLRQSSQELLA